ncbi:MAG TPA: hypothetical protein VFS44_08475 [Gemmatimonadaceae bacterium]|nr:hypothetical protein [Gemmatimonadaceae bacterium]
MRRSRPHPRCLLAALLLSTTLLACRDAASALGTSPATARADADLMLGALGARFGARSLDPRLDTLRFAFAKSAFTPQRLFRDRSLWTARTDSSREVDVAGAGTPGDYRLAVVPTLPALLRPGDYRRELRLLRLGKDDYEWTARDELAIGPVSAADLARALDALFATAERGNDAAVRAAYREQLPRTTAALSLLFSLDTLHLAPVAGGGTDVRLSMGIHTDRLAARFPRYAKYLDKYAGPAEVDMAVSDVDGHEWWRLHMAGGRIALALRVRGGSLAPLDGGSARMPDTVRLHVDATTKTWIFRVGASGLKADVALVRDAHEKAFVARFHEEPEWELPPLVSTMLRTPLRRPFEGEGTMLSMGVRDGSSTQTVAARDYRLVVRESRIMRWVGGLGSSALGDFRRGAEEESDRYNGEVLDALRHDLAALAGGK